MKSKNSLSCGNNLLKKSLLIGALSVIFNTNAMAGDSTNLPGLMNPVEVMYPETSVPTVNATSMADMAYMTGYLHAQDRLFQMDRLRRLVTGTLAELLGPGAISTDIELRTLGLNRAAFRSYEKASEETKVIVQAYANGVNAWLASNTLPIEYSGLELTVVKPWSPVDSIAIGKLISFQLSDDSREITDTIALGTMQQVGALAGFDGTALFFEDLYRSGPPDGRVTVPGFLESIGGVGGTAENNSQIIDTDTMTQYSVVDINLAKNIAQAWEATPDLKKLKNNSDRDKGSNVWAVSGDHTVSGYPLVANDPHLPLEYPSIFYPMHLYVENEDGVEYNAAGVGFPGTPGITQGCNPRLCWGSTVHPVDETDFYFEDIKTNLFGLPTHTVYQGNDEPLQWIFQFYNANIIGDGVMNNIEDQHVGYDAGGITFISARRNNGPIISSDPAASRAVTMQYTGFSPTQEIEALLDAARADDIYEFRQALTKFDVGSQNFGVADIDGNIAYYTGAEVPIREDLQTLMAPDGAPPMFIRDGTGAHMNEWMPVSNPQVNQAENHEIIPEAEMPHWENPAQGWFANANNDPIGLSADNNVLNQLRPGGGLYYLSQGAYSTYRMGRIDRLLTAAVADSEKVDASDMKSWQANTQAMDAELIMPHIVNAFNNAASEGAWPGIQQFLADPRITATLAKFSTWNYSMPTGVPEGYDPFENPFALSEPSDTEIDYSVAATIYVTWRSMAIQNTIDATIAGVDAAIGQDVLTPQLPGSKQAFNGFKNLLDNFDTAHGVGASGINFFTNPAAPTPEDARDFIILASLKQALDLLASDEFAPAFNNSTDIMDYRWGKLHRISFDHQLSADISIPNGLFGFSTIEGLHGIPRSGGYQVLDASSHSTRADTLDGFMFNSGPARRFVGLMTPIGPVMDQVIPGGQSGVITTQVLYVNQLFSWLVNSYLPLFIDIDLIDAIAVARQTYEP